MAETAEEQRARILKETDTKPADYDLAVAHGYEPESWDGMWKLSADNPFPVRMGRFVIAREVVYEPGTHKAVAVDEYTIKTRLKAHWIPDGWQVVTDQRLSEVTPRYSLVSPREREWLNNRFPWMIR